MSKITMRIRPIKDTKNNYIHDVDFEIDDEKVSMCFYDNDTGEHRTVSFAREDFKKLQNIIEASE